MICRFVWAQHTTIGAALVLGFLGACSSESSPSHTSSAAEPPADQVGSAGSAPDSSAPAATPAAPSGGNLQPSAAAGQPAAAPAPQPGAPAPTLSADNTPYCNARTVLDSQCTVCHNEQKVAGAPMSLRSFADLQLPALSDNTQKVYQLIGVRVHDTVKPMPPQQKLTAEQLSAIDTWVAAGGPEGDDPTCGGTIDPNAPLMPLPGATAGADATNAWPEQCDEVYTIRAHGDGGADSPLMIGAGQEIHPKLQIPAPWGEEGVQMVAMRAITDNAKVLHHWILYGSNQEFLVGWAPGKDGIAPLPPDVGQEMPGGTLTLDIHYYNLRGTQAEADRSGMEICVLKKEHFRPNSATVNQTFNSFLINIPARSVDFEVTGQCTFTGDAPVHLLSASPHAHTLAKHMKFSVTKRTGEVIVMHDAAFDFNEQGSFPLSPMLTLENGDMVTTTCTYDNPGDRAVTFGENTGNEMCFNFAVYYPAGQMACGAGGFNGPGGGVPAIPGAGGAPAIPGAGNAAN